MKKRLERCHLVVAVDLPREGDVFEILNDALNKQCTDNGILHHYSQSRAEYGTEVFWKLAKISVTTSTGRLTLKPPRDAAAHVTDGLRAELVHDRYARNFPKASYVIVGAWSPVCHSPSC